ncbi:MAG: TetR family transcriptional regulator [Robiginitomaculum sp.]|nr:MAG: TetR family transcriptional regulator [Robiginitomaculum sp.]
MTQIKTSLGNSARKKYHHGDLASELLRAAEAELSENGIESFSLRAVAKRAGVSHGAPAHHFTDVRGLLTALTAIGYERFVRAQNHRQQLAKSDPKSQLVASGLGYIDFAMQNPALFRLMFSSEKPDRSNERLAISARSAFDKLVTDAQNIHDADPYHDPIAMMDVMATWALVHGLADLMISGRMEQPMGFTQMAQLERDAAFTDIILRVIPDNADS